MTVWINGTWRARENATISVFDHGLLYGDGLFEGIRVYSGRIFRLKAHLDRLFDGARALMLKSPYDKNDLAALLWEAVEKNGGGDAYIRLLLTRGEGPLGIDPTNCEHAGLVIIVDTIRLYPEKCYKEGVPLITSSLRRTPSDSFDVRIKSLNYLNNVLARLEAKRAGAEEALFLNHQGHVAECTGDNIFAVRKGVLQYPASHEGALEGITARAVIEIAERLGLPVQPSVLLPYDLYIADEVFLTGTGAELVPVTSLDGRSIADGRPGHVFSQLRSEFHRLLEDADFCEGRKGSEQ